MTYALACNALQQPDAGKAEQLSHEIAPPVEGPEASDGADDDGPEEAAIPHGDAGHVHLCKFDHVEGAKLCESLYNHYRLPDGTMVHYYHRDELMEKLVVRVAEQPWRNAKESTDSALWRMCRCFTFSLHNRR